MEGGVDGAGGADVLQPVEKERWPGGENVTLQLQLMEEGSAMGTENRQSGVKTDLVRVQVRISTSTYILSTYFILLKTIVNIYISTSNDRNFYC